MSTMTDEEIAEAMRTIGANVKRIRMEKGLTQAEVAERAGISVSTLRRVEKGSSIRVRMRTLISVAEGLGVMPSEVVKGT